jgi:hypothetical protein
MLTAELYGKTTPETAAVQRQEDVLTSHALAPLRYFGPTPPFMQFLAEARNLADEGLLIRPVKELAVFHWPHVSVPTCFRREPDALLMLSHEDGPTTNIVVEAKYTSGPSDIFFGDPVVGQVARSGNQLAEYLIAAEFGTWRPRETASECVLSTGRSIVLYITADYTMPIDALSGALAAIEKDRGEQARTDAEAKLYWVSWRHLTALLDAPMEATAARSRGEARMLADLHGVLRRRGLEPFRAVFTELALVAPYRRSFTVAETASKLWAPATLPGVYKRALDGTGAA